MNEFYDANENENNPGLFRMGQNPGKWEPSTMLIINICSQLSVIVYFLGIIKTWHLNFIWNSPLLTHCHHSFQVRSFVLFILTSALCASVCGMQPYSANSSTHYSSGSWIPTVFSIKPLINQPRRSHRILFSLPEKVTGRVTSVLWLPPHASEQKLHCLWMMLWEYLPTHRICIFVNDFSSQIHNYIIPYYRQGTSFQVNVEYYWVYT